MHFLYGHVSLWLCESCHFVFLHHSRWREAGDEGSPVDQQRDAGGVSVPLHRQGPAGKSCSKEVKESVCSTHLYLSVYIYNKYSFVINISWFKCGVTGVYWPLIHWSYFEVTLGFMYLLPIYLDPNFATVNMNFTTLKLKIPEYCTLVLRGNGLDIPVCWRDINWNALNSVLWSVQGRGGVFA